MTGEDGDSNTKLEEKELESYLKHFFGETMYDNIFSGAINDFKSKQTEIKKKAYEKFHFLFDKTNFKKEDIDENEEIIIIFKQVASVQAAIEVVKDIIIKLNISVTQS
jgi:ribosomal protein L1